MAISTITVLQLRSDMLPISQEDYLVHEATNSRLLWYSTFEGTCSPYPKRIILSTRRQIIDYYSHRSLDGTSSQSPERIFPVHEMTNYSTTSILNLRTRHALISQKDFFIHEATIDRLLRYSILGWDKFPIFKDLVIQELTIHRLLRTRLRERTKEENNRLLQYLKQSLHFLQRNYSSTRLLANRLLRYSKK